MPKPSIADRAQLKAAGVIHTLKAALGKPVQKRVLCAAEDLFLGVRQKKTSLGGRWESSPGPGKQEECFTEARLLLRTQACP